MASHFSFLMVSLHSDSSSPSLVVAVQTPHVNGHFFFPFSVSHLPLAFLASHFSLLMVSLHSESSLSSYISPSPQSSYCATAIATNTANVENTSIVFMMLLNVPDE